MSTYHELMKQAKDLMAQAEAMRSSDRAIAISDIKKKMKEFEISVSDLEAGSKVSVKAVKGEPKYRGPNSELWSGGRGRKPAWVKEALAAGKDIEQFRL